MKTIKKSEDTLLRVKLSQGRDGYVIAECLEIPGCMSQGKSEEEAVRNIQDAIELCLLVMVESTLKKPRKGAKNGQRLFRLKAPRLEAVIT